MEREGTVDGLVIWWDLDMDGSGYAEGEEGNLLTMAPSWIEPMTQVSQLRKVKS